MITSTRENGRLTAGHHKVYAAGAVLWRFDANGHAEIGLIHRPRRDDWSLPKGKLNRGETAAVAAVREIREETGQRAALGRRLALIEYPIAQGTKIVGYWAARGYGGEFAPCKEVDQLLWAPVSEAATRLTHTRERQVLNQFTRTAVATQTVLMVGQSSAGLNSRSSSPSSDKRVRAHAKSFVSQMLAFGASDIYAANRNRCIQTVEPLARETGLPIRVEPTLDRDVYLRSLRSAHNRILEIAAMGGTPVICASSRVMSEVVQWWCDRDGVTPDNSLNRKGNVWVLSLWDGKIIAADNLAGGPSAQ